MPKQSKNKRKQYNISWNLDQKNELQRAVKNFNAKVGRLEKKYPELKHILPERVSVKELKGIIDTRRDLKREVNALKRFTSKDNKIEKKQDGSFTGVVTVPGNEYNMKVTKWQKEEMVRRVPYINRKREERRKEVADIDMSSRGKKLGYKKGDIGMGSADEAALDPIKPFSKYMNRTGLNKKFKVLRNESKELYWRMREKMLMDNYIQSLKENFRDKDVAEIIDAIEGMDFTEFYKIFQAEGGDFEKSYPLDEEGYQNNLSELKAIWTPEPIPESEG